jgi:hypothetical protein
MMVYRCPECGGEGLAICTRVWVNFPELTVEPEDAEDAEPTWALKLCAATRIVSTSLRYSKRVRATIGADRYALGYSDSAA